MSDQKAKITIENMEWALIVDSLIKNRQWELAMEVNSRFIAGDPTSDGPETTILMNDIYVIKAREWGITRVAAKYRMIAESYGSGLPG